MLATKVRAISLRYHDTGICLLNEATEYLSLVIQCYKIYMIDSVEENLAALKTSAKEDINSVTTKSTTLAQWC